MSNPTNDDERVWLAGRLTELGFPRAEKIIRACGVAGVDVSKAIGLVESKQRYSTSSKSFDPKNPGAPFTPLNVLSEENGQYLDGFLEICRSVNADLRDGPKPDK